MSSDRNKEIMARNIRKYMDQKGVTNQQICDALNFKYTTFMDWIKGVTYPRMPKVEAMADYFGILKSDLIEEKTIENDPVGMAERHFEIIMDEDISEIFEDFKTLDVKKRKIVKDLVKSLAETE